MKRQLQIKEGIAQAEWQGSGGMPVPPDDSWTFIDVTDRLEAQVGMIFDADSDTFSAAPVTPKTRVSKSQVVSVLTPNEWAEMGKYQPTADPPYDDADVYWAVTQFQLADYVDLADPRYQQIIGGLVAKGLLSQARAAQMYTDLMALANG